VILGAYIYAARPQPNDLLGTRFESWAELKPELVLEAKRLPKGLKMTIVSSVIPQSYLNHTQSYLDRLPT
jgi:hypothetical protein